MEDRAPQHVHIDSAGVTLAGDLFVPDAAAGVVVFAHGSGSSRNSPRNREVAQALQRGRLATLLMDLLTPDEEQIDERTRELRFDIPLLSVRLAGTIDWLAGREDTRGLRVGFFGASTGGGAALVAAAERPDTVGAVVSRGGRPDLAGDRLAAVRAATLLVVGGNDPQVLELNRGALAALTCTKRLEVVPGAGHLFSEPGTLEAVADLATGWFRAHLPPGSPRNG